VTEDKGKAEDDSCERDERGQSIIAVEYEKAYKNDTYIFKSIRNTDEFNAGGDSPTSATPSNTASNLPTAALTSYTTIFREINEKRITSYTFRLAIKSFRSL
jgi:hypothetical protein